MTDEVVQLATAEYVTIRVAALVTGLSEKAIRRKIEGGDWVEGREFRRAPDGHIFVSMGGYRKWVEQGPGSRRVERASASSSSSTG